MRFSNLLATGLCSLLLWGQTALAGSTPAGTEFNYQGLLKSSGAAITDDVDIKARLFDSETDGTQIGTELELLNVPVTEGVFSIELDFGSVFSGAERWLELEVKLSADLPAAYEILAPRQEIKPSPFSLFSLSTGLIPDGSLAGTYSQELQLTNVNNTVAGDGSGLTNLSASSISGGTISNSLNLTSVSNSFTGDGGGLTNLSWSSLTGVPGGFADGIDNDTIVWSTSGGNAYYNSGNVGIGTTNPQRKLFVEDASINTFIGVQSPLQTGILFGSDTLDSDGGIVFNHPNNPHGLDFRTAGNITRMSINDSGNLGIGTTSPAGRLDVVGQTITDSLTVGNAIGSPTDFYVHSTLAGVDDAPALISVNQWNVGGPLTEGLRLSNRNLTGAVGLGLLGGANNVTDLPQVYLGTFGGSGQNNFRIATNNDGTMRDRVFVDGDSGNVGIGTTSPSSKLEVRGDSSWPLWVTGTTNAGIRMKSDGTSSSWAVYHESSTDSLNFRDSTTGATRLSITGDSGYVGIGTTSPTQRLDVAGTAAVDVLQIRGGADIVEGFETSCGTVLEPGTVVVIDPNTAGALMESADAYDFKVAGVVSGANGVAPGIHLGQDGVMDGETKVAMTGRVYVKCSAENGAIKPGTLLTTASIPGHAMAATDAARSNGAVIGKAMSSLDEGTGLVLVLVNLQ